MSANRILVVEDDPSISAAVTLNLRFAGYEYAVFHDGAEAAAYLEADHSFDLALLDIMLDSANREVLKSGVRVELTPLEFDVLRILMKHKNRTVSREQLLNEIWGEDYFGDLRTVDVRIAGLRKKLGFTDEIRAISKTGYRLEERHK